MISCQYYYARTFVKIFTSRYPSRTLRVPFATARFSTKMEIAAFSNLWKRLETQLET